jgi:hypothetical protein
LRIVVSRPPIVAPAISSAPGVPSGECAAVLAQRFRVYQRRGYYASGLRDDRDAHDDKAL